MLLRPSSRRHLRDEELIDDNFRAVLHGRQQFPQDLDAVAIRPVVQYEAEEVDVRILDRLFREEIMRHERDTVFQILWQQVCSLLHCAWKVLHNELQITSCVGQCRTDATVATSNVDDGSARFVQSSPIVAVDQMANVVQRPAGHETHPSTKASRSLRRFGELEVERIAGVVLDVESSLVGLARSGPLLEGLDDLCRGGSEVFEEEADGVHGLGIFFEEPGGGGVLHVAEFGLGKDSVYHCGLDEAPKKDFIEVAGARDVGVGYGAIQGDVFGDVVVVDEAEGQKVIELLELSG